MSQQRQELQELEKLYRGGKQVNNDPEKFDSTLLQEISQMNDDISQNAVIDQQTNNNQPQDYNGAFDSFKENSSTKNQSQIPENFSFSQEQEKEEESRLHSDNQVYQFQIENVKMPELQEYKQENDDYNNNIPIKEKLDEINDEILCATSLIQKDSTTEINISDRYECELTIINRKSQMAQIFAITTNILLFTYFLTHFVNLVQVLFDDVSFDQAVKYGERNIDNLEDINNYSSEGESILFKSQYFSLLIFLMGYLYNGTNLYGLLRENFVKQENQHLFFLHVQENQAFRNYFFSYGSFLIIYLIGSIFQIMNFNFHSEYDQLQITQNNLSSTVSQKETTYNSQQDDQTNQIFFAFLVIFLLLIQITITIASFTSVKLFMNYRIQKYNMNSQLSFIKD